MKKYLRYGFILVIVLVIVGGYLIYNNPRRQKESLVRGFANKLFTVTVEDQEAEYFAYDEASKVKKIDAEAFKHYQKYMTDNEFQRLMDERILYRYIMGSLANEYLSEVVNVTFSRPVEISKDPEVYIVYALVGVEVTFITTNNKVIDHVPCEFTIINQDGYKISKFIPEDRDSFLIPMRR